MKASRVCTAAMALCAASLTSFAQEPLARCDAILAEGVFDSKARRIEFDERVKTFDWICDDEVRTESDVDRIGASLGFPIEGIPVELGFDSDKQKFSNWKKTHCEKHQRNRDTRLREENILRTASSEILSTFERCIQSPGVYVWREPSSDRDELVFASRFVPLRVEDTTAKLQFDYPAAQLQCQSVPSSAGVAIQTWRCHRKSPEAFTIAVSSDVTHVAPTTFRIAKFMQPTKLECRATGDVRTLSSSVDNRESRTPPIVIDKSPCPITVELRGESRAYSTAGGTVTITVEASFDGAASRPICSQTIQGSVNIGANTDCSIDVPANVDVSLTAHQGNSNANAVSTLLLVRKPVVTASQVPVIDGD